jgi:hypothetical protein
MKLLGDPAHEERAIVDLRLLLEGNGVTGLGKKELRGLLSGIGWDADLACYATLMVPRPEWVEKVLGPLVPDSPPGEPETKQEETH